MFYTMIKTCYKQDEVLSMTKKANCGRPAGRKKTSKIEVTIEPDVKDAFMKLIHDDGKTASTEIGQWIREYIKEKSEDKQ